VDASTKWGFLPFPSSFPSFFCFFRKCVLFFCKDKVINTPFLMGSYGSQIDYSWDFCFFTVEGELPLAGQEGFSRGPSSLCSQYSVKWVSLCRLFGSAFIPCFSGGSLLIFDSFTNFFFFVPSLFLFSPVLPPLLCSPDPRPSQLPVFFYPGKELKILNLKLPPH